jgi:hypothetical protein
MDGSVVKLIAGRLDELIGQAQRIEAKEREEARKRVAVVLVLIDGWIDRWMDI